MGGAGAGAGTREGAGGHAPSPGDVARAQTAATPASHTKQRAFGGYQALSMDNMTGAPPGLESVGGLSAPHAFAGMGVGVGSKSSASQTELGQSAPDGNQNQMLANSYAYG